MKGELIFRIFVDILSYPFEFFNLRDFIICSISINNLNDLYKLFLISSYIT